MTQKQLALFIQIASDLVKEGQLQMMNQYIQHGTITTLDHSLMVAYYSLLVVRILHLHADEISLIRGALLHDYFLYDWHEHESWHRFHGFRHPGFALQNARKHYQLNKIEEEIIRKHMWPLTIIPPTCREAWIVNAVDTFSTIVEVIMDYPFLAIIKRKWYQQLDDTIFKEIKQL